MSNIDKQALRISELEELNELLREKVKKLESDLWDKEQLRQVYSEKSFNLDSKVRELEARNQKDFVWRGNEISRLNDEVDELKEKLEAAEKRIAEQREYYEGVIADGSKRIAELESNEVREVGNQFLVVRHPGKTPAIKHCTGDLEEFLRKLIEQDPLVTIDIITHRYYGVGGQWVQDTGEYLQMMQGAGIGVKGE
ncbi:ead/Ea22-like family protein [Salmonella enterica]|nr:ead/Ea22-like family protein [Salmonella enterica]